MGKSEVFQKELETIINDDIREFAIKLLDNAPDYFYTVSASSSGRFHPSYALGEGGLCRHTRAVVRFLNHILTIEQHSSLFTDRQKDCMRVACLYHDGEKQGNGKSKNTVFDHPLLAAQTIRKYKGEYLSKSEIEYIAKIIESHMGQFNTNKRSKTILPKPCTKEQKLVHLADYLASKKDLIVLFDNNEIKPSEPVDINTYQMPFGQYKGMLILDVAKDHMDYLKWLNGNMKDLREPLKTFINDILTNN